MAFDKATGKIQWQTPLPTTGFGHSTPVLIHAGGADQLIVVASAMGMAPDGIQSFGPADGKRLWWCAGGGDAASPAYGAGILYADSGRGGPGVAVDPTGRGDVSATHVKWQARTASEINSPIIVGDLLYRLQARSVRCFRADTGASVQSRQLDGRPSPWASPIADPRGYLYFASAGTSFVVKAGPDLEVLAVNDLGDPNHPSPAASDGRLFLVGTKSIHCIGAK